MNKNLWFFKDRKQTLIFASFFFIVKVFKLQNIVEQILYLTCFKSIKENMLMH